MLTLRLLGGARLESEAGPLNGPATQRHRLALLALLAAAHPQGVGRDRLFSHLWPERDTRRARNLLNQSVHTVRLALGKQAILSNGEELRLDGERLQCDLLAFLAALRARRPDRAVGFYAGPFLDGFSLPGSAGFEHWLDGERARFRRVYVGALEELAERASAVGHPATAVEWWQRLAAQEPLDTRITLRLMETLEQVGNRAGALQEARRHELLLREELGADPDPAVAVLAERLRLQPDGAHPTSPTLPTRPRPGGPIRRDPRAGRASRAPWALVGRDGEWERLRSAWERAAAGEARCVLIAGEAGIGKTRLAEELLDHLGAVAIPTARTRCYAAEGRLPYAPVADWLRRPALGARVRSLEPSWLAEVARLVPELRDEYPDLPPVEPVTERWQRQRLFHALGRAVVGSREPLALLLDDLQWADTDTLQWLHFLLRLDVDAPLLVVGTARRDEVEAEHPLVPLLLELRARDQLEEIVLAPLAPEATVALAAEVAGHDLEPGTAAAVYSQTEGHPLFVVETIRARSSAGAPVTVLVNAPLPARVQAVIRLRLRRLSPFARELAAIAATIGRDFTSGVLQAVAGHADEDLARGLDELCARGLVREHGNGDFDFSHDRVREVAQGEVGPVQGRLLHRRVAEALELLHARNLDAVSARLAAHYEHAALAEPAIAFHQRAAENAERIHAHDEAVAHLERALKLLDHLTPGPDRDRAEITIRIALATALRVARGWAATELERVLAPARAPCERLGDVAGMSAVLHGLQSYHFVRGVALPRARELGEELLQLASRQTTPEAASFLLVARFQLGSTLTQTGEFTAALRELEQVTALYDARERHDPITWYGPDPGVLGHAFAAHTLWHLGYPDRALERSRSSLRLARELEQPFGEAIALAYAAMFHQFRREPDHVERMATAALELSTEQGFPYYHAWARILLGWASVERGRANGLPRLRDALADILRTGAELRRSYYLGLLARASMRLGRTGEAADLVDEALDVANRSGEHWQDADLLRLRGELLHARGDLPSAELSFIQALDTARRQGARMLELRAAVNLSRLRRAQSRAADAIDLLAPIHAGFGEGHDTPDLLDAHAILAGA